MDFAGIHNVPKRGCRIMVCDPSQRLIEAKIQRGEIITINAYTLDPVWRWPKVGEMWEVREENGSWILGGIWEEREASLIAVVRIQAELGSTASVGKVGIK